MPPGHTVSLQVYGSLSFPVELKHYVLTHDFFRKNSTFSSKFSCLTFFYTLQLQKQLLFATYGASVCESVLRTISLICHRQFELVETSPGLARRVSTLHTYYQFLS